MCVCVSRPITTKKRQAFFTCRKLSVYYRNRSKTVVAEEKLGGSCLTDPFVGSAWDVVFAFRVISKGSSTVGV